MTNLLYPGTSDFVCMFTCWVGSDHTVQWTAVSFVSVYVSVSIHLVPLSEITFPALCGHIFIAIRHDVISPGLEQSYLLGRSRSVQRAPSPVLLPPMPDLPHHCWTLITASHSGPCTHHGATVEMLILSWAFTTRVCGYVAAVASVWGCCVGFCRPGRVIHKMILKQR